MAPFVDVWKLRLREDILTCPSVSASEGRSETKAAAFCPALLHKGRRDHFVSQLDPCSVASPCSDLALNYTGSLPRIPPRHHPCLFELGVTGGLSPGLQASVVEREQGRGSRSGRDRPACSIGWGGLPGAI